MSDLEEVKVDDFKEIDQKIDVGKLDSWYREMISGSNISLGLVKDMRRFVILGGFNKKNVSNIHHIYNIFMKSKEFEQFLDDTICFMTHCFGEPYERPIRLVNIENFKQKVNDFRKKCSTFFIETKVIKEKIDYGSISPYGIDENTYKKNIENDIESIYKTYLIYIEFMELYDYYIIKTLDKTFKDLDYKYINDLKKFFIDFYPQETIVINSKDFELFREYKVNYGKIIGIFCLSTIFCYYYSSLNDDITFIYFITSLYTSLSSLFYIFYSKFIIFRVRDDKLYLKYLRSKICQSIVYIFTGFDYNMYMNLPENNYIHITGSCFINDDTNILIKTSKKKSLEWEYQEVVVNKETELYGKPENPRFGLPPKIKFY